MEKARKLGLTKAKLLNNIKLLIFSFKIYPFILNKKKQNFVNEIYNYFLSMEKDYKTFIKYFQTNWEISKFLDFEVLSDGTINNRTNNMVEAVHHKINNAIGYSHPKLSVIIDKLKIFSIQYYHKYINKLFTKDNDKQNSTNIFNDIYNFLSKFLNKYKKNIDFKLLLQDEGETKKKIDVICNRILKSLYNYNVTEDEENKDLSDESIDEIGELNDLIND